MDSVEVGDVLLTSPSDYFREFCGKGKCWGLERARCEISVRLVEKGGDDFLCLTSWMVRFLLILMPKVVRYYTLYNLRRS